MLLEEAGRGRAAGSAFVRGVARGGCPSAGDNRRVSKLFGQVSGVHWGPNRTAGASCGMPAARHLKALYCLHLRGWAGAHARGLF